MPYLKRRTDSPFGFNPHNHVLRIHPYLKDSAAAAIYPGDAVILESDGGLAVAAASSVAIIGVAAQYSAVSTEVAQFMVYDHPDQEFVVQDDGDTTAMTSASVGENVDLIVTTGDTTTLRSLHEIDASSSSTTATLACKVIGLHPVEGTATADFATTSGNPRKWIVKFNSHLHSAEVLGV